MPAWRVDPDFAPLNPGYSLRDADLPRQRRTNMPDAGFQYDGIYMANAVPASQRGVIWTRISLSLNPGYGLQ